MMRIIKKNYLYRNLYLLFLGSMLIVLSCNAALANETEDLLISIQFNSRPLEKTIDLNVKSIYVEIYTSENLIIRGEYHAKSADLIKVKELPIDVALDLIVTGIDSSNNAIFSGTKSARLKKGVNNAVTVNTFPINEEIGALFSTPPVDFSVSRSAEGVELSWQRVKNAQGYYVYYGSNSHRYSDIVDSGSANKFFLPLSNDTTKYFAVKAYDSENNLSWYSREIALYPATTTPIFWLEGTAHEETSQRTPASVTLIKVEVEGNDIRKITRIFDASS